MTDERSLVEENYTIYTSHFTFIPCITNSSQITHIYIYPSITISYYWMRGVCLRRATPSTRVILHLSQVSQILVKLPTFHIYPKYHNFLWLDERSLVEESYTIYTSHFTSISSITNSGQITHISHLSQVSQFLMTVWEESVWEELQHLHESN